MSCVRGYASEHMALNTRHEGFVNRLGEMQECRQRLLQSQDGGSGLSEHPLSKAAWWKFAIPIVTPRRGRQHAYSTSRQLHAVHPWPNLMRWLSNKTIDVCLLDVDPMLQSQRRWYTAYLNRQVA